MAKPASRFVCHSCGAVTLKWAGRCETCGEWNTIEEEPVVARPGAASKAPIGRSINFVGLAGSAEPPPRAPIGIAELDRVLGGGLVPASAVLVGGDPGIGKSTLLLQAAARLAGSGHRVLYVSGEELVDQIRMRARRLGVAGSTIELAAAINVRDIAATLEQAKDTTLVVIELDPDHVAGRHRKRTRHSGPGPRLLVRTYPDGQGGQICLGARRTCHERRRVGRPTSAGAHG